jgi:sortase A
MPDHRNTTAPGEHTFRPRRWLERLFLIVGAGALIWCVVIVTDGEIAQRKAQSALEIAMAVEELTAAAPMRKADVPSSPPPVDVGSAIAALSIPRVQLSAMVLHGSDTRTLQRGPGHLEHTAVPGEGGNVVIAGHRDSFFRPLRHIRLGDDIFLETRDGRFHYRVTSLRVVGPREVSVLAPTTDEVLTLITCYPFWVLGHAPDRFIVRAAVVTDRPSSVIESRQLPALDWTIAPALERVRAKTSISARVVAARDDESLVRGTVNGYLHSRGVPAGTCVVTVDGDRATADCEPEAVLPEKERSGRVFFLQRSNDAWAIRSIELRQGE